MLPTPQRFTLVAGSAEGDTKLTAFDKALLVAGVGNLNLLRVSSILPPGAEYSQRLDIPPGSLTPIAYGTISSETPGRLISAAIGVGIISGSFGVIMEFTGMCTKAEAEARVEKMVREALAIRNALPERIMIKATEHTVEKVGCSFAGAVLWY
ncbi:MAG: arginine decarboxylase, pyruvoyl-dependent [Firmicutes bacterium]|nr:arginine decarboxylase, pyruvoyl-dependent [Bacillota bacterium]HXL04443.1 arginine decarboxylase, pyruvoyl-dependent [Bacillota bacterium]